MKKANLSPFKFHHLVPLVVALLGLPSSGHGSPITIAITGTVRLVDDPDNILTGTVAPGDTITGVYTYDSARPDSNTFPEVGDYWHTSPM